MPTNVCPVIFLFCLNRGFFMLQETRCSIFSITIEQNKVKNYPLTLLQTFLRLTLARNFRKADKKSPTSVGAPTSFDIL